MMNWKTGASTYAKQIIPFVISTVLMVLYNLNTPNTVINLVKHIKSNSP